MSRPFQIALAAFATVVLALGVALLFGVFDDQPAGTPVGLEGSPDELDTDGSGAGLSGTGLSGTGAGDGGRVGTGAAVDGSSTGRVRPGQRQPSGPDYTDPETAIKILRKSLLEGEPDWKLALQVFKVYEGALPEDIRAELLGSLRTSDRIYAIKAFYVLHDGGMARDLFDILDDPEIDPGVYSAALSVLGGYGAADNDQVVRGFEARLRGEFAKDRSMLSHLARRGGPEATRAIIDYMGRMEHPTRLDYQLFGKLKAHESEEAARYVREAFESASDTATKLTLMRIAAQPGAETFAEQVIALDVDGEDDQVRDKALQTLAHMGGSRSIEYLLELGKQPGTQGARARTAIGWISAADPESRELLTKAYERASTSPEPEKTRAQLLTAFGNLGHEGALPTLREALKDKSTRVRVAAVDALGSFGSKAQASSAEIIAFYGENKSDETQAMRAVVALGNVGGAKALSALEQIAADPTAHKNVKRSAQGLSRRMRATQPRTPGSGVVLNTGDGEGDK